MPNDEDALAYFITFTCYGTWLHGDERGSKHRRGRDDVVEIEPNSARRQSASERMRSSPVTLDRARRRVVDNAIRETCEFHGWYLRALNVRTNHVHLVVSSDVIPARVVNAAKSRATRMLRQARLVDSIEQVWTRGASKRYLWTDDDAAGACHYVLYAQGPDLV